MIGSTYSDLLKTLTISTFSIKSNNDEYYTPEAAIQMLKPYLQQTKYKIGDEQCWTVWEPFIGNPYTESPVTIFLNMIYLITVMAIVILS